MRIKIIFFSLLFLTGYVYSGEHPKIEFPIDGNILMNVTSGGAPISNTVAVPGIDPAQLSQLNTADKITSYQNTIELVLKNHSAFDEDVNVNIEGSIVYYPIDGTSPVSKNIKLGIEFQSGALKKSNISSIYAFTNAYKVDINVTNVNYSGASGYDPVMLKNKLINFIELVISFQEESFTRIDYNSVVGGIIGCNDASTDELVISWKPVDYAEEYELEITFCDDYGSIYSPISPSQISFNFKDNSTRVSTKETFYRLPLTSSRGYYLYRIRAIGRGGSDLDLPVRCKWSGGGVSEGIVSSFTDKFYHNSAHMNDNINWQVITTFVEDGKRSDVITYYDGTFRARQTVTGVNLEKLDDPTGSSTYCVPPGSEMKREVIAGETIYDFQGRPSVNILPVPTNSLKIQYFNKLNISDATSQPYSWEDFDKLSFNCSPTNKLSNNIFSGIMGASSYYSQNNPNKSGFNSFLPDAHGFPFSQISYTPDNTGRVSSQGGLDQIFQLGNGHQTRFFYASPNQEELDRMFGTEVGFAMRYQKNAVQDPNGQVSVTYLNPEGKVIATSLAGNSPDNVEPLINQNTSTINVSLLGKNILNETDKTITAQHQFFVSADNSEYIFDYSISPEILNVVKCDGTQVCLDCIYDINIKLTHVESCTSVPIYDYSGTLGTLLNISTQLPDMSCSNAPFSQQIRQNLDVGTYIFTKTITVNQQAGIEYVNEVFKDTCRNKWDEILNDEFSKIDTTSCYNSCLECSEPPVQTTTCDTAYCRPAPNKCEVIRQMMLADMSPGGQYAEFDRNSDGTIDASSYPLSILNLNNLLPYNNPSSSGYPFDIFFRFPSGSNITDYNSLVNNWRPEYAELLLPLHPEFCMKGWCDNDYIDTTLDFDVQILSINNYADAVSKGFINPSAGNIFRQLLDLDPWFDGGANPGIYTALLIRLSSYGCDGTGRPIDELAEEMAYCAFNNPITYTGGVPEINDPSIPSCTIPAGYSATHIFGSDNTPPLTGEPSLADLEWTFLSGLYLSAKNVALQQNLDLYASNNSCDNKCIGADNYFSSSFNPCSTWKFLYSDKQLRFGSEMRSIFNAMDDGGITIDLSGVDLNDPCTVMSVIQSQSGNINQQASSTFCGESSVTPCQQSIAFVNVINTILRELREQQTISLSGNQIPASLASSGINMITGTIYGRDKIVLQIHNGPAPCLIELPFLNIDTSRFAPVSVCCISNITCNNYGCSFDMKVTYANNTSNIVHITTKCNFLDDCKTIESNSCPDKSAYAVALKDYLNAVFQFHSAYGNFPSESQLLSMLPDILKHKDGKTAESVTINSSVDFTISINYPGTTVIDGRFESGEIRRINEKEKDFPVREKRRVCLIKLEESSGFNDWTSIRGISNLNPRFQSSGNITNDFTLTAITPNRTVNITGFVECWPVNECPPEVTLCDSIPQFPPIPYSNSCVTDMFAMAYANATIRYQQWVDSMKNDLLRQYFAKCLNALEKIDMAYTDKQYHYTLYYYDQAGNLVKTVPPAGVNFLDASLTEQVDISRKNNYATTILPQHSKYTVYRYNTLNELVWQETPDAGESNFYYDELGRISASQNAKQQTEGSYSYTRYDKLGRIYESGKVKNSGVINSSVTRDYTGWESFIGSQPEREEITLTKYDDFYLPSINLKFGLSGQRNLRIRVASILSFADVPGLNSKTYLHATHYSYDILGNVYRLIQDYPNGIIGDKTLDYSYDLQSGKVNKVTYQPGAPDQFIHKYSYDALNRLIRVKTSAEGLIWETDAEYFYYRHGPLARMELGTDKVQGLDYIYTLQGWIKGVNGTSLDSLTDMGQDGLVGNITTTDGYGSLHNPIARDAFGYVLDYFNNDYAPISGNACLDALNRQVGTVSPLYNGNISRMYTQIQKLGNTGFNYKYDQLNRFISQDGWKIENNNMLTTGDAYFMHMQYDSDGNIVNMQRNGTASLPLMDKLQYRYYRKDNINTYDPLAGVPNDATNRISFVADDPALTGNYTEDIDAQNPNNYSYDEIGNLISDNAEGINSIEWTLQNKIKSINKSDGTTIRFEYDAIGNRIMKAVLTGDPQKDITTYYTRDAQGNIMATYLHKVPNTETTQLKLFFDEAHIYGSSRLGVYKPEKEIPFVFPPSGVVGDYHPGIILHLRTAGLYDSLIYGNSFKDEINKNKGTINTFRVKRGLKQYELTNHLGNVLVTITDKKLPHLNNGTVENYNADISTSLDYYPFGMLMPEKIFSSNKYMFGFNGKENDNVVIGVGNQQDYGTRIYDTRIGKFLSIDPISTKYPWYTPYQFAGNTPIQAIDLDGLEGVTSTRIYVEFKIGVKFGSKALDEALTEEFSIGGYSISIALTLPNANITGRIFYDTKLNIVGIEDLKGEATLIAIKVKIKKGNFVLNNFNFSPGYSSDLGIGEYTKPSQPSILNIKNKSVFSESKFSGSGNGGYNISNKPGIYAEYKKWGLDFNSKGFKLTLPPNEIPIGATGLFFTYQFAFGLEKHEIQAGLELWFPPPLPPESSKWSEEQKIDWMDNAPVKHYMFWKEEKNNLRNSPHAKDAEF